VASASPSLGYHRPTLADTSGNSNPAGQLAKPVLVAGAGGFIGGHLARALVEQGVPVRAVDSKPIAEWHQVFGEAENRQLDLRLLDACREAVGGVCQVYNLAADMGGIGYIEYHKAACMLSVLINTHLLVAARDEGVERYFFSSSACVYSADRQRSADVGALKEEDAYPALPEDGYGWEKLFSERMCRHFFEDYGIETRIVRYHNAYGPVGTFDGGREKAPAAICRKVIEALDTGKGSIDIWGDGHQTRSFTYIDDCVKGIDMITHCDDLIATPINLGSHEMVSINELVTKVERIAGVKLERRYDLDAPRGVAGRNSDNTFIKQVLSWEPNTTLDQGMAATYAWIKEQYDARRQGKKVVE
jgi:GDP-D-mannose 3', 5'-epimerase